MKMQYWISLALLFAALLAAPPISLAGQDSLPAEALNKVPEPSAEIMNEIPEPPVSQGAPSASHSYFLSGGILILTLALMILGFLLIKADKIRSENAIRFLVLALITGGTLFLAASGLSNSQLAPTAGLLGVAAGYLLGSWKNGKT